MVKIVGVAIVPAHPERHRLQDVRHLLVTAREQVLPKVIRCHIDPGKLAGAQVAEEHLASVIRRQRRVATGRVLEGIPELLSDAVLEPGREQVVSRSLGLCDPPQALSLTEKRRTTG